MQQQRQVQWTGIWFLVLVCVYCALAFLWPGGDAQWNANFFLQWAVVQFGVLLIPAVALRRGLKLPALSWRARRGFLPVLGMVAGVLMLLPFLNLLWMAMLHTLSWQLITPPLPPMDSLGGWLVGMACIALIPAFVEEFTFRGVLQQALRPIGPNAIFWTALLFALLHLDMQGLPARLILGLVLGYLAYTSGSLGLGIFYHFCHNAATVTLTMLLGLYQRWIADVLPSDMLQQSTEQAAMLFDSSSMWWLLLVFLPLAVGGVLLTWFCIQFFRRQISPNRDPLGQRFRELGARLGMHGRYEGEMDLMVPTLNNPVIMTARISWPYWASLVVLLGMYVVARLL